MPGGHLYVFMEKYLFRSSIHFICFELFAYLILNCTRCLCILDINPLFVVLFSNIFLHCIGCLFILSMVLFPIQKLLCLIRSVLFLVILVFFFCFRGLIQAYTAMIYVKQHSSMFSSGSLMFSVLTFRSLNHLEFIFYMV